MQALSSSAQLEAVIGSWPAAGGRNPAALDAELPDFRGKPVHTGSNLATMAAAQGMSRTGSFNSGGVSGAAAIAAAAVGASGAVLSREGSFNAESFFNACNSAPITPRSPMTPLFDLAAGTGTAGAQLDAVSSGFAKVRSPSPRMIAARTLGQCMARCECLRWGPGMSLTCRPHELCRTWPLP